MILPVPYEFEDEIFVPYFLFEDGVYVQIDIGKRELHTLKSVKVVTLYRGDGVHLQKIGFYVFEVVEHGTHVVAYCQRFSIARSKDHLHVIASVPEGLGLFYVQPFYQKLGLGIRMSKRSENLELVQYVGSYRIEGQYVVHIYLKDR